MSNTSAPKSKGEFEQQLSTLLKGLSTSDKLTHEVVAKHLLKVSGGSAHHGSPHWGYVTNAAFIPGPPEAQLVIATSTSFQPPKLDFKGTTESSCCFCHSWSA